MESSRSNAKSYQDTSLNGLTALGKDEKSKEVQMNPEEMNGVSEGIRLTEEMLEYYHQKGKCTLIRRNMKRLLFGCMAPLPMMLIRRSSVKRWKVCTGRKKQPDSWREAFRGEVRHINNTLKLWWATQKVHKTHKIVLHDESLYSMDFPPSHSTKV